jgi:opacity protein-like surface antigen
MKKIIAASVLSLLPLTAFCAETYNFSGIYLGANLQETWSKNKINYIDIPDDAYIDHYSLNTNGGGNKNMNEFSIAPIIGIQKQFENNFLLGIEGSYSPKKFSKTSLNDTSLSTDMSDGYDTTEIKVKNVATVSAKLGYVINNQNNYLNNTLLYAKLGMARAESETHSSEPEKGYPDHNGYSSATHYGALYGLGLEKSLSFLNPSLDNLLLGVEYNYIDLNAKTSGYDFPSSLPGSIDAGYKVDPRLETLGLKIVYKFGSSKF